MGVAEEALPLDVPLMILGMDSIMAMDMQQQLQAAIGQQLPGNLAFEYPSVADIARVIATILWAAHAGDGGLMDSSLGEEVEI
jgi:acyl carrier protein